MPKLIVTKYTQELADALIARGLEVELEHWDKHKHIDIYIPVGRLCIEIDGIQHLTNSLQIEEDFLRTYYSSLEQLGTIHIPNELIIKYQDQIADAITKVAHDRQNNLTS